MSKRAIITGASGQDAYYLSKLLLDKGYEVVATQRRSARPQADTVEELMANSNYSIFEGDVTDMPSLVRTVRDMQPVEFYHLAAQSEVGTSWNQPVSTVDINGMGTLNCLETIRLHKPDCRFYFAGTSEQFGNAHGGRKLTEHSPMLPRSPYAAAKLMGFHLNRIYRNSYDMFTCGGILFNHESPQRKLYFVTRKITDAVARIQLGLSDHVSLGNLDASRDWGHSADFMRAAWMMMQHDKPDDYVIATGQTYSIKDFLQHAFAVVGIDKWENYVKQDPRFMRPHDVPILLGDASKAREVLGWKPEYSFAEMVEEMVVEDIMRLKNGPKEVNNGFTEDNPTDV
jgi:GDPmannose 4,6-dehydratase